ncbi:Asparagine synthetase [uncultured Desulfovibrio sp.]|uniref:asparagine synthase (glutamine-hydrolyzing) n=1 Tax=uncultured Desulfovibrio sp. TaxID=167968 RepID=A0A212K0U6_9BACT|nr:asparagine synthase (glutamine-hydrolyzing) [Desulfovibrio desulfuricans]MCB6541222.1 asparagine synthase (glutamine-hydrolyzing) [Desulfovibrio desulfuricans]MCB6552304.1 asparagine synthase (glutamine-hydrolyzing) [Desulfovibrio desulfuricans]MCB6564147.1 asparagine synthase (glutamine-hydrolyzing) [Desulfovibrio desulfuricans]MCB7345327.1 asparagine synthase (glutamine-hydrolyzing) [Desulfovibrio desulfuricans]MCQ4860461.1 asparagine synthase (glutamine-hydrolyzing) [Desulfovibrio desulf
MCGIAGTCQVDASPLTPEAGQWVKAMTDRMSHRGPDGEGQWSSGPVCLGHRRLSIIDLSGGGQPMHSADGQMTVTFNGEIYNYAELKEQLTALGGQFQTSSDTEVILEGYRIWGPDCLARFDGMFAFALWDNQQRRLFCARDRFGKKPFFYTVQHGRLYFASELTGIEQLRHLSLTMNPQAVMRYLAYEYVPTPHSVYTEVQSLPPSHMLLLQDGNLSISRYWDMPMPDESDRRSDNELCEELRFLLSRAVRRRMVSDVPLGVFLSGGIDSSIVAGLMARQSSTAIKTFSIGFSEASYDESRYARIVAKAFATDHHERVLSAEECADTLPGIISRMDVPMADASVAPTWLLSGVTREKVTVALGGDGADELWAGYEHYIGFKVAQWYNAAPSALRKGIIEPLAQLLPSSAGYINPRLAVATFLRAAHAPAWQRVQTMLTAFTPDMQESILDSAFKAQQPGFLAPEVLFAPTREHYDHWQPQNAATPLARAFHVYARQFMLDDILVKVDRCSMLHSLEVRAPFLDKDAAEFAARLPVGRKLHGFKRKWLLKKAFAELLPDEILYRNKRGFQIPVAQWLRGRMRPLMEDLLSESTLKAQGIFNHQAVRALMDEHVSGRADLRKPLWTLLVFQLWWRARHP